MKYFIANWKGYKNHTEVEQWLTAFFAQIQTNHAFANKLNNDEVKIIICPPSSLILSVKEKIKSYKNIHLGAQDISSFDEGPYTGEVTGKNLQGLVDYVIIGHSERRRYFEENDDILLKKIASSQKYQIAPIFCLESPQQLSSVNVDFIAYEPVAAIGTGKNESLESILSVKSSLKLNQSAKFIYGGSVNKNNITAYLACSQIDGFLIASASLDPLNFYNIVILA